MQPLGYIICALVCGAINLLIYINFPADLRTSLIISLVGTWIVSALWIAVCSDCWKEDREKKEHVEQSIKELNERLERYVSANKITEEKLVRLRMEHRAVLSDRRERVLRVLLALAGADNVGDLGEAGERYWETLEADLNITDVDCAGPVGPAGPPSADPVGPAGPPSPAGVQQ